MRRLRPVHRNTLWPLARARQKQKQANRTVLLVLLAILAVGLLIRGFAMNWQ